MGANVFGCLHRLHRLLLQGLVVHLRQVVAQRNRRQVAVVQVEVLELDTVLRTVVQTVVLEAGLVDRLVGQVADQMVRSLVAQQEVVALEKLAQTLEEHLLENSSVEHNLTDRNTLRFCLAVRRWQVPAVAQTVHTENGHNRQCTDCRQAQTVKTAICPSLQKTDGQQVRCHRHRELA